MRVYVAQLMQVTMVEKSRESSVGIALATERRDFTENTNPISGRLDVTPLLVNMRDV